MYQKYNKNTTYLSPEKKAKTHTNKKLPIQNH
jgi:hypothetical protein